jgi:hypothetical protein
MITIRARASSLPTYDQQCARLWAARNLPRKMTASYGLRELQSHVGAAIGTATHAGAAHLMTEFGKSGEVGGTPRREEAREIAIASLREATIEGLTFDPVTPDPNSGERQIGAMVAVYHGSIAPDVPPLLVERGLKMMIADTIEITGHVDLFLIDQVPDDLKTGRHRPQAFSQYGSYSLLLRANGFPVAGKFRERYMPRVAVGKPQPAPEVREFPQGILERQALSSAKRIARDLAEFDRTGDPETFAANPASWLCKEHLCPAWGTTFCNAWRLKQ